MSIQVACGVTSSGWKGFLHEFHGSETRATLAPCTALPARCDNIYRSRAKNHAASVAIHACGSHAATTGSTICFVASEEAKFVNR